MILQISLILSVLVLSAVSGKVPDALKVMREIGVERMFEVIGSNDDLRHKYLACNAVLSVTDYGDYNLTDMVAPKAKLLYDAGMSARDSYTELFEGVMDVLQVRVPNTMYILKDRQTEGQTNRRTDKHTDRQTDGQTNRWTEALQA